MGQAAVELPDPLTKTPAPATSADDLLSQLAGEEIDRLLKEAEVDPAPTPAPVEQAASRVAHAPAKAECAAGAVSIKRARNDRQGGDSHTVQRDCGDYLRDRIPARALTWASLLCRRFLFDRWRRLPVMQRQRLVVLRDRHAPAEAERAAGDLQPGRGLPSLVFAAVDQLD